MPLALVLLGLLIWFLLIRLTDHLERNRSARRQMITPAQPPRTIPPFLTSLDQCIGCGHNKDPWGEPLELNLERRCRNCHDFHHLGGVRG